MKATTLAVLLGVLVLTSACSHTEPTLSEQLAQDFEESQSASSVPPSDAVVSEPIDSSSLDDSFAPAPLSPEPPKAYKKAKNSKKAKKRLAKAKSRKKKGKRKGLARK